MSNKIWLGNRRNRTNTIRRASIEMFESRTLLSGANDIYVVNGSYLTIGQYTTDGTTVNANLLSVGNLSSNATSPTGIVASGSDLFLGFGYAEENPNQNLIGEYTTSGATVNGSLINVSDPQDLAISGSDIFVTSTGGVVGEYTTSGATINASLITTASGLNGIVVSGSDLFVTNSQTGTIGEYTTSGATVNASLVTGLSDPAGLVVSGSDIFVANSGSLYTDGSGSVGEYTTSGVTVNASLISGLNYAGAIGISGSDLFVANSPNAGSFIGEYTTSGATVNASLISNAGVSYGDAGGIFITAPVVVGAASQLALGAIPSTATTGTAISPAITVNVEDANGNLITTDNSNVTISIATGPTGATLGGTATVAAVDGVATFSNLTLPTAGTYTLTATDGSYSAITSGSLTVSSPAPTLIYTSVSLATSSPSIPLGGSETLTATIVPVTSTSLEPTGTVNFSLSDGVSLGTAQVTDGVASLTTTSLPAGEDDLVAAYLGDSNFTSGDNLSGSNTSVDVTTAAVSSGALVPTILKSTLPAAVVGGAKVQGAFNLSITNTAPTAISGKIKDRVVIFASTTGVIDSSSTQIALTTISPNFKAGQTTKARLSLKTLALPAGNYTLLAQITQSSGVVSYASTGPSLTVAAPFVGVSGSVGAVKPTTVVAGKSVLFKLTLTNTGNISATGKMSIAFGLSSDGVTLAIPLTTKIKGSVTVKPGGKPVSIQLSFRIPVGTLAGSYFPFLTLIQGSTDLSIVGTVPFTIG